MDTTTVLEIIKMIQTQKDTLMNDEEMFQEEYYGAMNALNELQGHLQDYIEGQVSAIENSTGE
jgi:uncharacterized protein YaaN involved in tellurite resistance